MMKRKYYTPNELVLHDTVHDCWVSFLGKVYDLTPLFEEHQGDELLGPIIAAGGTDISHWFDPQTGDVRHHVDLETKCLIPYTPFGRFLHIPPPFPTTDWATDFGKPWWRDDKYALGYLTKKTRFVRIVNTLALKKTEIEVCVEETMKDILARYLRFNAHAASYTWKYIGRILDMEKTLEENGIMEETQDIEDQFMPELFLYYNDDLTEA